MISELLYNIGVVNLQNFWFILAPTWILQINKASNFDDKQQYIKHINTGNNGDFANIKITLPIHQEIFFNTISLVFNISIQMNTITKNTHSTITINLTNQPNRLKIINWRLSYSNEKVFEPWINPAILESVIKMVF